MSVPKLRFKNFMVSSKWGEILLGNALDLIKDGTHGTHKDVENGPYLLSAKNIKNNKVIFNNSDRKISEAEYNQIYKNYSLKHNDILLTVVGSIGEVAIYQKLDEEKIAFQRSVAILRSNPKNNPYFLGYLMQTFKFKKLLNIHKVVSAQPGIYLGDLAKLSVSIPNQLEEQNKIAKFFIQLDKKIKLQQEKIDLLKEQKKAYQLKLFNTEGWMGIRLGDYADIKGRLGWKGLKQEEYVDNGPYLIAGKHIVRGQIQWDKCDMITNERYEESMEIALEKEDIIFSKDGSLGNPAYISNLPDKATINSTMMLVRVQRKEELDSNFVYHILNSHIFKKLIHLKVSGSSIPHLFQADMKEFSFAIPNDINEQKQIANFFNLIDRKISLAYEKLDSLKLLKQGFMQQMFI